MQKKSPPFHFLLFPFIPFRTFLNSLGENASLTLNKISIIIEKYGKKSCILIKK